MVFRAFSLARPQLLQLHNTIQGVMHSLAGLCFPTCVTYTCNEVHRWFHRVVCLPGYIYSFISNPSVNNLRDTFLSEGIEHVGQWPCFFLVLHFLALSFCAPLQSLCSILWDYRYFSLSFLLSCIVCVFSSFSVYIWCFFCSLSLSLSHMSSAHNCCMIAIARDVD